jgi:hypothetical protein
MSSKLETILLALKAKLETIPYATVARCEVLPVAITTDGLIILRDGDPGEPDVTMSPLMYHYEHRAVIEIFVPGTEGRDALFDTLRTSVGALIVADRTLGGLCDWIEAEASEPTDIPFDGADTVKAASIPVVLHFVTDNPLS